MGVVFLIDFKFLVCLAESECLRTADNPPKLPLLHALQWKYDVRFLL